MKLEKKKEKQSNAEFGIYVCKIFPIKRGIQLVGILSILTMLFYLVMIGLNYNHVLSNELCLSFQFFGLFTLMFNNFFWIRWFISDTPKTRKDLVRCMYLYIVFVIMGSIIHIFYGCTFFLSFDPE